MPASTLTSFDRHSGCFDLLLSAGQSCFCSLAIIISLVWSMACVYWLTDVRCYVHWPQAGALPRSFRLTRRPHIHCFWEGISVSIQYSRVPIIKHFLSPVSFHSDPTIEYCSSKPTFVLTLGYGRRNVIYFKDHSQKLTTDYIIFHFLCNKHIRLYCT